MALPSRTLWTVLLGSALLAGCAGPIGPRASSQEPQWQPPGPRGGACEAAPAQGFIGQAGTASVIEKARIASGAAMARVLHPNQATTQEFKQERLNLILNDKGRIAVVRCG